MNLLRKRKTKALWQCNYSLEYLRKVERANVPADQLKNHDEWVAGLKEKENK